MSDSVGYNGRFIEDNLNSSPEVNHEKMEDMYKLVEWLTMCDWDWAIKQAERLENAKLDDPKNSHGSLTNYLRRIHGVLKRRWMDLNYEITVLHDNNYNLAYIAYQKNDISKAYGVGKTEAAAIMDLHKAQAKSHRENTDAG